MSEVTFVATVDESHVLRLELPLEISGEVEVVVRERESKGSGDKDNGAALLAAIQRLSPRTEEDVAFWREAREELYRDRDAWDED